MARKKLYMEKRDHDWRDDRIAELEAENAQLRVALGVQHVDAYAQARGTEGYREAVQELIAERDRSRVWIQEALAFWDNLQENMRRAVGIEKSVFEFESRHLPEGEQWREFQPFMIEVLDRVAHSTASMMIDQYGRLEATIDFKDPLIKTAFEVMRGAETAAIYQVSRYLRAVLWAMSGAPELLANEVLEQAKREKLDHALVTLLCDHWKGGPRASKLIEALTNATAYRKIEARYTTMEAAAAAMNIPYRTLQNHLRTVGSLEKLAEIPLGWRYQAEEFLNARFPDAVESHAQYIDAGGE